MPYDVLGLAHHLRSIGVAVSTQEIRDTYAAVELLGAERAYSALAMTLVKDADSRRALASIAPLFADDVSTTAGADAGDALTVHLRAADDHTLHTFIRGALTGRDLHGIAAAAKELVDRHVLIQPGAPVAGNVHVLRAYRQARPDQLRQELEDEFTTSALDPLARLRERRWNDEVDRKLETLRQAIETEVRRRLVHDRGARSVAEAVRASLPGDVDFLTASTKDIHQLSSVLENLPSRLARQLRAGDARPPSGRLDARRTMRSSMSTGGVPVRPVFHPRPPPKPELVVLADISGSVASFARFTLSLAHGLQSRFHSVRSFVFIDGVDEVTDLVRGSTDVRATAEQIDAQQLGVHLDGHSDYGRTFQQFWQSFGHQLSPRTIVLVLGDGRSNYRDPQDDALKAIGQRAGRLFWLSPERSATWHDGDCLMDTYRPHCSGVFEVRTVRQLEDFVLRHAR
jgi:uncharacterized protein with von Willebrand factor type A (vWA) domain